MLGIIVRGMAMGMTEVVPGVSGSTVAMILGVYERLIYSLSVVTTDRRNEVIPFLVTFGFGMIIGFASALYIIRYLLENYNTPTLLFFLGIIVGFLPYLWGEAQQQAKAGLQTKHYIIIFIFISIVIVGQLLSGITSVEINNLSIINYAFLIVSGFIASTALVLPGISGALIFMILGVYEIATDSLLTLNLPVILSIGAGVIIGVLLTSKLIRFLLANYSAGTYSAMLGLVIGSIYAISDNLSGPVNGQVILMSLVTFAAGFVLVVFLKRYQNSRFG
jgi:putative membrane protein